MANIPQTIKLDENSDVRMTSSTPAPDISHTDSSEAVAIVTSDPAFSDTPQTPLAPGQGRIASSSPALLLTPQHNNVRDIAFDTPPPSGGLRKFDSGTMEDLQMEGGTSPMVASHEDLAGGMQLPQQDVTSVWGNRKAQEEYEIAREKLVDQSFSLEWAADDFDESDMWEDAPREQPAIVDNVT